MRLLCCCGGDDPQPPNNQLRITMLRVKCFARQVSVWYTGVNDPSATCPDPAPIPIDGCGCGCAYVASAKPTYYCDFTSTTYEFPVQPYDFSGKATASHSQVVLLDYQDQVNVGSTANWRFDDGASVIITNFTYGFNQARFRYANLAVPFLNQVPTSGSDSFSCCESVPGSTFPLYGWFWDRGTYASDISAFGVYGAAAAYANWTVEITAADCIVRDAAGTVIYTWALAAYTMDGLRLAIDNTPELVGRRIALASGTNLRNARAAAIPPQGPKVVNQSLATEAKIVLRQAGQQIEGYQISGKASYLTSTTNNPIAPPVTEEFFSGTLSQFRVGFSRQDDSSPPPGIGWSGSSNQCNPGAPATCGILSVTMSPVVSSGGGGFGAASDPLSGTATDTVWTFDSVRSYFVTAGTGFGSNCYSTACVNESNYDWYFLRYRYEVERI